MAFKLPIFIVVDANRVYLGAFGNMEQVHEWLTNSSIDNKITEFQLNEVGIGFTELIVASKRKFMGRNGWEHSTTINKYFIIRDTVNLERVMSMVIGPKEK